MSSKIIGYVWFNGRTSIGIVLAHNQIENKLKAWIATVSGGDLDSDIQHIRDWGSKFPVHEAISLVERFGELSVGKDDFLRLVATTDWTIEESGK